MAEDFEKLTAEELDRIAGGICTRAEINKCCSIIGNKVKWGKELEAKKILNNMIFMRKKFTSSDYEEELRKAGLLKGN